jgi:hypothetical protein
VGIECRAWFVVGELLETRLGLFRWIQQARGRIAREILRQAGDRSARTFSNRTGSLRIGGSQLLQSLLKPGGIELMDGEDSNTALGAARLANQPFSTAASGFDQPGVNNLNQLGVA